MTRFKENPFIKDLVIPLKNRQVQISRLGADNNIVINQDTGEYLGGTSVVTYKKVDSTQFIKLFTQNIKLAFELTQAGQKALYVLFWVVQQEGQNKDQVLLDQFTLEEFLNIHPELKMSLPTYWRGLAELVKAQILAMAYRKGHYFINPNFIFNGDRVAFTTVIEVNKQKQVADN
ncbi:replication/maintenance protein RepL [Escherichia coli]|nr:replication/maintenance protein RepL [Escherichia coli]